MGQCDFNASIKNNPLSKQEKQSDDYLNDKYYQAKKGIIDLSSENKVKIEKIDTSNKGVNNNIKKELVLIQRPISKLESNRAKTPGIINNNAIIKKEGIRVINNVNNNAGIKIINKNIGIQNNNNINNNNAQKLNINTKPVSSRPLSAKVPVIAGNNYKDNIAIAKKLVSDRNNSPARYINNQYNNNNKSPIIKKVSNNNSPKNILVRPSSGRDIKANNILVNNNQRGKVIEKINYERKPMEINKIYDNKNIKPNYHLKPSNQINISNNNKAGYLDAIRIIGDNKGYVNNGPKIAVINQNHYKR